MEPKGTIALRKLALKSKLGFGKHAELTVQNIMDSNPYYLVWAYYNCDKISYVDEVLNMLQEKFPKFITIVKPGKAPEHHEVVCIPDLKSGLLNYGNCSYTKLKNMIIQCKLRGQTPSSSLLEHFYRKRSNRIKAQQNKEEYVKSSLQAKNHGR